MLPTVYTALVSTNFFITTLRRTSLGRLNKKLSAKHNTGLLWLLSVASLLGLVFAGSTSAHCWQYSLVVGRSFTGAALKIKGAWPHKFQTVTHNEKLTLKWKSSNVKNSIRLVKTREPMNGIGICIAKICADFQCAACEDTKLRLSKLSSVGAPQNELGKECTIGLPHSSCASLR